MVILLKEWGYPRNFLFTLPFETGLVGQALAVGQNVPSAQTQGFGARAGVRIDACVMYNPDWAP